MKLKVIIDIDTSSPARISIRDNAAGIYSTEYKRAFRPAAIPLDRTGLSEFGMGMKSSACWFSPKRPDGVMEIGLGIRPGDTGKGLGQVFVEQCVAFGRSRYQYHGEISLRVADFNVRAIRLYERIGFVETRREAALSFGTPVMFVRMEMA